MKKLPKEFTFICDENSREQLEKLGVDLRRWNCNDYNTIYSVKDNYLSAFEKDYPLINLADYLDQEQPELSGNIPASDRVITSVVSIGLNGSMDIKPIKQPEPKWQEKTRGGYEYHIYEEFEGKIFGKLKSADGEWHGLNWNLDGSFYSSNCEDSWDLLPINHELTTLEKELEEVRSKEKQILEKIEGLKTK